MKVRVKFAKYGALRFIGHLDVMRHFQKVIRRAGIDIAYSTGFSPHQIMSFASPLGLGMYSRSEYMDIEVHTRKDEGTHVGLPMRDPSDPDTFGDMDAAEMMRRLNAACAPGIEVLDVRLLPADAGNAMASVAAARYTLCLKEEEEGGPALDRDIFFERLTEAIPGFLAQDEIQVVKQTKKGSLTADIRPGIYELWMRPDGMLEMLVDASSAGNIKPMALLGALCDYAGQPVPPFASWKVTREETYTNTGTGQERRLIPLSDVGETF